MIDWGREVCGDLAIAEAREWLCTNGLGGFASGTVAGTLTRRYHGLLVAALAPPLGRRLLVAKLDEVVRLDGVAWALHTNRWVDGVVEPQGYRHIERFRLDGGVPEWTFACADALVTRRIWMEQGANTTYVRYDVVRSARPLDLEVRALVDHRDYHGSTHAGGWRMRVERVPGGARIEAFDGAAPLIVLADTGVVTPQHTWYERFHLARERDRGLDDREDHLHAATIDARLAPGGSLTVVLSADPALAAGDAVASESDAALARRRGHDAGVLASWRATDAAAEGAPAWIERLVLAADQFVVARAQPHDPGGRTVIAGYPWFGDWGRDTMIALPGLTLATGRPEIAGRILRTFADFVDRGMLPNRFPDEGEAPEYNTADATLWFVEAIRACHAVTEDDGLLKDLWPVLENIVEWHVRGTRYGIGVDPDDGLLRSGADGVQLTWMDARVGERVITPRTGKAVEINALWYNALCAMASFARRLRRPARPWAGRAERVAASFGRFWNEGAGHCHDVVDGPDGDESALRPNQLLAVSLFASPLSPRQQRGVVEACARELLTSYGLRSLAPREPGYRGRYGGDASARDGAYHQGTVWSWLLGPFALAHYRVHGDRDAARRFLAPLGHHVADHGVGSIAEIFGGEPPFRPDGCTAQAWGVAETLRAWHALAEGREPFPGVAVS